MVVVVVVAIHLGGGSWGLNSSQPLVFFFKFFLKINFILNLEIIFIISKTSSVNYYNKLTQKIGNFFNKIISFVNKFK
jgi:hypothetical protein